MILDQWATAWNIPAEAVQDLRARFGLVSTDPNPQAGESEAAIQTRIRLEASRLGGRLFRNNVGGTPAKVSTVCPRCQSYFEIKQTPIRYGLANDSPQLNKVIKSSDLIGIKPVLITPAHVGHTIGQFVAREVKAAGWTYGATDREVAQLKFLELIASLGGDAAFANREGTLE